MKQILTAVFFLMLSLNSYSQTAESKFDKAVVVLRLAERAVKNSSGLMFEFESYGTGNLKTKTPQRVGTGVYIPLPKQDRYLARYDFKKTLDGNTSGIVLSFDGEVAYLQDDQKRTLLFSPQHRMSGLLLKFNIDTYLFQLSDPDPFSQLKTKATLWEGTKVMDGMNCDIVKIVSDEGTTIITGYFDKSDHLPRLIEEKNTSKGNGEGGTVLKLMHPRKLTKVSDEQFALSPPADFTKKEYAKGPAVGDLAPEWNVKDYNGEVRSLKSFKGSVLIMGLLGHVVRTVPHVDSFPADSIHEIPASIIQHCRIYMERIWRSSQFAKEIGVTYAIAKGDDLAQSYGIDSTGIPTMYVIGPDGRVKDFFIGYGGKQTDEKLLSVVEEALKNRN